MTRYCTICGCDYDEHNYAYHTAEYHRINSYIRYNPSDTSKLAKGGIMTCPKCNFRLTLGGLCDNSYCDAHSYAHIEKPTLQELVDTANKALAELDKQKDKLEVRSVTGDRYYNIKHSIHSTHWVFRIKQPAFKPFTVNNGLWSVNLQGDSIYIGCRVFNAEALLLDLRHLVREDAMYACESAMSSSDKLYATRKGIKFKEHVLTWDDAEKVLVAVEEALEKKS